MGAGNFHNWYLAGDDLVNPRENSPVMTPFRFSPPKPGPYVRNLILRDRVGDDCYWKLTETESGHHIQAARGRYEGGGPPTAWNLVLNKNLVEGAYWKLTRTEHGHLFQATVDRYRGWYLDYLLEANVLERNRCWGEATRRDDPKPLLQRAPKQWRPVQSVAFSPDGRRIFVAIRDVRSHYSYQALVRIGQPAVPALLGLLEGTNEGNRSAAAKALKEIDPQQHEQVSALQDTLEVKYVTR